MIHTLPDTQYFNYEVYDNTVHSNLLYNKKLFNNIKLWMNNTFGDEFTYHLRCVEGVIIAFFLHYNDAVLFELTWG